MFFLHSCAIFSLQSQAISRHNYNSFGLAIFFCSTINLGAKNCFAADSKPIPELQVFKIWCSRDNFFSTDCQINHFFFFLNEVSRFNFKFNLGQSERTATAQLVTAVNRVHMVSIHFIKIK